MRTGNLTSLSERDHLAIRERLEFERDEQEKQRLAEDQAEYDKYVRTVEEDQQRVPPAHRIKPISLEVWRAYADPAISDPVLRGAKATNRALLHLAGIEEQKKRDAASEDVKAGKIDQAFQIPESAEGLSMSVEQAKEYACKQAELFVSHNPKYYPTAKNFQAISKYLSEQTNVVIPNEECFRLAWLRLCELGMIDERPQPEPEPVQQQPSDTTAEPELVDGFDPVTGQERKFTQAEIWKMDSATYRKAFRMWGDSRPRFTRGYFG